MICRLFAVWLAVDWTGPWTAPARGSGPYLDRQLYDVNRPRLHRLSDVLYPEARP